MGLFDIMSDISSKQIVKTETGDNRIFGVMVGTVVQKYDDKMKGRICVTIPMRDTDANELQWARVAMPYIGPKYGQYFMPEIGDQVLLVFENGNIEKPFVIGCVPQFNSSEAFVKASANKDNTIKQIVTKHGSTIRFDDAEGEDAEEGEKDKITIKTPQNKLQLIMNNEKQKISIEAVGEDGSQNEQKCSLVMDVSKGLVEIKASSEINFVVGDDNAKLNMKKNGNVILDCNTLTCKPSKDLVLEASGNASISGNQMKMEGGSSVTISSSGTAKIDAQLVQE